MGTNIFEKSSMYKGWLGYSNKLEKSVLEGFKEYCKKIVMAEPTNSIESNILSELKRGISGLLLIEPSAGTDVSGKSLVVGTFEDNIVDAYLNKDEKELVKTEGYIIKKAENVLLIAALDTVGLLYGTFAFLRAIQMKRNPETIHIIENPAKSLRMINHWDNIDGSIERGYAGRSIFYENNEIKKDLSRIVDYARLLASTGINSIVINNVNVHKYETQLIFPGMLPRVVELADIFRGYGIKLFVSANYASPMEVGDLNTADPLDSGVAEWWKKKADEIYKFIPDFGGFLIKADSEFRPGPFTYGRTHADGANMLAAALKEHGGIVVWRCFVYNCRQDWRDLSIDRARASYDHFMPIDGEFMENVYLQIKNGPMDFQVREPVSPLIGGLKKTNMTVEFQITQEYTGQQKHVCYLVPMWKEVLNFDTYRTGKGSEVKKVVDGIAAVVNVGEDLNWTGHQLAQANLYGYGRIIWNPELSTEEITDEWIKQTFSDDKKVYDTVNDILLNSWRTYENYNAPLGIGWMVNPNHHFGPNVDGYEYANWGTYHRADLKAIGVDRTVKAGTGYVGQYPKEIADIYENVESCPEELLLFFHRIPYDYVLKTGKTIIQHIYDTHFEGVEQVVEMKDKWDALKGLVDDEIFQHVSERLDGQIGFAKEWRDVINSYFLRKTGIDDIKGRKIY